MPSETGSPAITCGVTLDTATISADLATGEVSDCANPTVKQGAAPAPTTATGSVYPTFIFGRGAYAQVKLDGIKTTYLKEADKSDPLNQLRVVGWKTMYGTLIKNQNFFLRIESTSAFNATFG